MKELITPMWIGYRDANFVNHSKRVEAAYKALESAGHIEFIRGENLIWHEVPRTVKPIIRPRGVGFKCPCCNKQLFLSEVT